MLVFIHAESCRSDSALNIFMPSLSKRDRAALLGNRLGLTRLLEAAPRRNCLIVLNYHRIGDARTSQYDSAVFSATAEEFETQVAHLRRYYNVVSLDEAVASLLNPGWNAASRILITFDDGYLDNYTTAFPILKAHGLSAVFFLS
jgi:peptidoglycan/xylan/chitin deacetylase (PgdA/CDA1 family)